MLHYQSSSTTKRKFRRKVQKKKTWRRVKFAYIRHHTSTKCKGRDQLPKKKLKKKKNQSQQKYACSQVSRDEIEKEARLELTTSAAKICTQSFPYTMIPSVSICSSLNA